MKDWHPKTSANENTTSLQPWVYMLTHHISISASLEATVLSKPHACTNLAEGLHPLLLQSGDWGIGHPPGSPASCTCPSCFLAASLQSQHQICGYFVMVWRGRHSTSKQGDVTEGHRNSAVGGRDFCQTKPVLNRASLPKPWSYDSKSSLFGTLCSGKKNYIIFPAYISSAHPFTDRCLLL